MSEYWKSTPSYWCKFCAHYVRDTPLERRNHEGSLKHQNNIQRSLRELHKGQERESRDKQRAKDEVARLNGLVGGAKTSPATNTVVVTAKATPAGSVAALSAQQRKAHAEQLAAMGVELPDELKAEVSGVGGWKVVSEKVVEEQAGEWSLAGIKREVKEEEGKGDVKGSVEGIAQGVRKRRADGDEDELGGEGEGRVKRKVWGSSLKTFPGAKGESEDTSDLEALLSGVGAKKAPEVKDEPEVKEEVSGSAGDVKQEEVEEKPLAVINPVVADASSNGSGQSAPPAVVFKKRKGKK